MRRLIWARPARSDLDDIIGWYGRISPRLSVRLIDLIERAPLTLLDYPDLGEAMRRSRERKWPVRGTPFVLLYVATSRTIEVRRVVDARSDWQRR